MNSRLTPASISRLRILATGGTIDKIYFDALSDFQVGDSEVAELLRQARVEFPFEVEQVLRKDSIEITAADRDLICRKAAECEERHLLVTHGTDTMVETALQLGQSITNKIIILTGAMQPSRFRQSEAAFNLGAAVAALQILPEGVYICMSGQIFPSGTVRKNRAEERFVRVQADGSRLR